MAVIGTGHLGRHHARNLAALSGVELVAVCDPSEERGRAAAELAGTGWVRSPDELPGDLDAVSIAAPTPLHFELASRYLRDGVHCLVEKPMTATSKEARRLCGIAAESGALLQVGHIERFNPVLDELDPAAVSPRLIEAWRLAPYSGRSIDTSVVFDLMIHDLDLALWFAGSEVSSVEARGGVLIGPLPDWAGCTLRFASGAVAHLTASRVAPSPERRMIVHHPGGTIDLDFGRRRRCLFDEDGVREHQGGDDEPLRRELAHFVDRIRSCEPVLVSEREGLQAVELAEEVLSQI
jgi:predicted dehydrogenase